MSDKLPYLDNEWRPLDDLTPEQESRLQTFFGERFQSFGYVVDSPEDFGDEEMQYFLLVLSDALDTALSKLATAQERLKLYEELEKAADRLFKADAAWKAHLTNACRIGAMTGCAAISCKY